MNTSTCQTTFIKLNNIPTKVIVFNPSIILQPIDNDIVFDAEKMILMISGNPGEVEYYTHFLNHLHNQFTIPVIGLSNSGHNRLPDGLSMPEVFDNTGLYSLQGQIFNKAKFIENHITERTKLVLVGHSIGCYMILELLDRYPNIRSMVEHSILIFPTIDSMIDTESGQKVNRLFTYCYYPLILLAHVLETFTTQSMKKWLVSHSFKKNVNFKSDPQRVPDIVISSATNLLNPNQLKALICMTHCEFKEVKTPNIEAIRRNKDRLSILYGEADHWCPVDNFHRIIQYFQPNEVDIRCCLGKIDHAFVTDPEDTELIAKLSIEIIQKCFK